MVEQDRFRRMKNRLYIFLTISVAIVLSMGCTKEQRGEENGSNAISFSCVATKALVDNVDALRSSGVCVYGFETDAKSVSSTIFSKEPLSYSAGDGKWSYTGASKYWTPGSNYHFIGLYPKDKNYSNSGNVVTLSNYSISQYSYGSQEDLMAGCTYREFVKSSTGSFDKSDVVLPMSHYLSAVVFKVRDAASDGTISISDVYLTGLYVSGSCEITPNESADGYTPVWTTSGDRLASNSRIYTGDTTISGISVGDTEYDLFKEKLLVIPQSVSSDIVLRLKVTPGDGSGVTYKVLNLNSVGTITSWQPGKKYTYIANVTDQQITFKLSVNDWNEEEVIDIN